MEFCCNEKYTNAVRIQKHGCQLFHSFLYEMKKDGICYNEKYTNAVRIQKRGCQFFHSFLYEMKKKSTQFLNDCYIFSSRLMVET